MHDFVHNNGDRASVFLVGMPFQAFFYLAREELLMQRDRRKSERIPTFDDNSYFYYIHIFKNETAHRFAEGGQVVNNVVTAAPGFSSSSR